MKFRLTILLVLLNAAAFAALYFLEWRSPRSADGVMPATILSPALAEADRIVFSGRAIGARRVLERRGDRWFLEEPLQWKANPFATDRMLRHLVSLPREISFTVAAVRAGQQDLALYGLDDPELVVSLFRRGEETRLEIGAPTDIGGRYYLHKPQEDRIFVVDERTLLRLAIDMTELQSEEIFDLGYFEVETLEIVQAGERTIRTRMVMDSDGQWRMESPIQARANNPVVEQRLNRLTQLQAKGFIAGNDFDPALGGLLNPRLRVTIEGEGRRQTLLIGDEGTMGDSGDTRVFAKLESIPTIFLLESDLVDAFTDAQNTMRDRHVLDFTISTLDEIEIVEGNRQILLQKLEDNRWEVLMENGEGGRVRFPADEQVLVETVHNLLNQKAVRFASDAPSEAELEEFGLIDPPRTLRIRSDLETSLWFGRIDPDTMTVYAKLEHEPYVYQLPIRALRLFPADHLHYRDRKVASFPSGARLRHITIIDRQTGVQLIHVEIGEDGITWKRQEPPLSGEQQVAVANLILKLREFRVSSFLDNATSEGLEIEPGRIEPWRFELQATARLPSGEGFREEERTYLFTDRLEGTFQAGIVAGDDIAFVLGQRWIDLLQPLTDDLDLPDEFEPHPREAPPGPDPSADSPSRENGSVVKE